MHQEEFCQQFNLIEFVREHPQDVAPFALEFADKNVNFKQSGIIEFLPHKASNQYLILSAGVHGNETAPIEILSDLVSSILNGRLNLSLNLLVIIGNPRAMLVQQRFTGFNLNRLFNGEWRHYLEKPEAEYEAKRAALIEAEVRRFFKLAPNNEFGAERYHYDLHTAIKPSLHQKFAIYPFLHERKHSKAQIKFLLDAGVDTILVSNKASNTFSYFTSHQFKAHGFTVELGKAKAFGDNNRQDFIEAEKTLAQLISGEYKFVRDADTSDCNLYKVKTELVRQNAMDELAFDNDVPNFTQFNQGDLLLDAGKNSYQVETDGEAIVFPNNSVPVGQRMCLVVEKS